MGRTLGNYTLGERIGSGGMSEVFAGTHRFLGDPVAIKLVREAGGDDLLDALIGEANRVRVIEHPNVVRVLDVGRDDTSGACYLVMERVDGGTLDDWLRPGPMAEADVRRLGAAIADGVQAAHEAGIVHCDLKPGNIAMAGDEPKIVDFGIARRVAAGAGRRLGTPAYMAPEQLASGVATPSVDIWALGVILYRALTGRLPFDTAGGATPQLSEAAPRLASSGYHAPDLALLIDSCLERDPARRPPSMAEVARSLRGGADDRLTQDLGEPPIAATEPPPPRAKRWPIVAAGLVAVGGAALAAVLATSGGDAATPVDAGALAVAAASIDAGADAATLPAAIELEIRSDPPGADVLVDGAFRGVTPVRLPVELPATIAARKSGYQTAERRVDRAGPVELTLEPIRRRRRPSRSPPPGRPAGETLD